MGPVQVIYRSWFGNFLFSHELSVPKPDTKIADYTTRDAHWPQRGGNIGSGADPTQSSCQACCPWPFPSSRWSSCHTQSVLILMSFTACSLFFRVRWPTYHPKKTGKPTPHFFHSLATDGSAWKLISLSHFVLFLYLQDVLRVSSFPASRKKDKLSWLLACLLAVPDAIGINPASG